MTVLVLGPNGSGKSVYAEKLAMRLSTGALYYVATMIPWGEEGQSRIDKHRKRRENVDFVTVEQPTDISGMKFPPDAVVLLEDVSNLLSNVMFTGSRKGSADSVFADIKTLCAKRRAAVLVSIEGLTNEPAYDDETRGYIDALNQLNENLSGFADVVVTMRDGRPVFVKGESSLNTTEDRFLSKVNRH